MSVLNLAVTALFDSLTRNNFDRELLLEGTSLELDHMLNIKKKHSWHDFVKMYENLSRVLGPEKAVKEIAYHGLYNENMSTIRKWGSSFFDAKTIYWGIAVFISKHLFRGNVTFKYTKIEAKKILMEIIISPDVEDCPLLLETYKYLFENVPTVLGQSKALVEATFTERKGEYNIHLTQASFFRTLYSKFFGPEEKNENSIILMTQLENQSIELSKLIDEKSELLRIMSHDIANSAALIDMSLKKVLAKELVSDEAKGIIENAKKSSDRLCSILKNVQRLEIAHLKGLNLGPVNIDEVFASVKEKFSVQLDLKAIELACYNNLPLDVKVWAERSSLEASVLSNLVSNAIKFSNAGSIVTLDAYLEEDHVVIAVGDHGRGIFPGTKNNLFGKYIQQSTIGTNGEAGTGFGLGIVNKYVQLYGGKISVHDNYPRGTIFKIKLAKSQSEMLVLESAKNDHCEINQTLH